MPQNIEKPKALIEEEAKVRAKYNKPLAALERERARKNDEVDAIAKSRSDVSPSQRDAILSEAEIEKSKVFIAVADKKAPLEQKSAEEVKSLWPQYDWSQAKQDAFDKQEATKDKVTHSAPAKIAKVAIAAQDKVQRKKIQATIRQYLTADSVVAGASEITHSEAPVSADMYREAFRETLRELDAANPNISAAIYPNGGQGVTVDVEGNVVLQYLKSNKAQSHLMQDKDRTDAVRAVEAFVANNDLNAVKKGLDQLLQDETSFTFKNVAAVVTKNGNVLLAMPNGAYEVLSPKPGAETPSQNVGTPKSAVKAAIKP